MRLPRIGERLRWLPNNAILVVTGLYPPEVLVETGREAGTQAAVNERWGRDWELIVSAGYVEFLEDPFVLWVKEVLDAAEVQDIQS